MVVVAQCERTFVQTPRVTGGIDSEIDPWSYPNEEYLFCALDDGDLRVICNGSCRSSTARDRAAHAIARGQPQPVDVGTDKQPDSGADAVGLRHRPNGCAAGLVATESVGSRPTG